MAEKRGFAGLQPHTALVDAAIRKAQQPATADSAPRPATAAAPTRIPIVPHKPYPASSESGWQAADGKAWELNSEIWWVLGFSVLIIWWIASSNDSSTTSTPSSEGASASSSSATVSSWMEEVPPVGQGLILSTPEIRYCVAEDIRIKAMKAVVDNSAHHEIDAYNAIVADYNQRCSSFRYRQGSLEAVQRDANDRRLQLQTEGRRRVTHFRHQGDAGPSYPQLASRIEVAGMDR